MSNVTQHGNGTCDLMTLDIQTVPPQSPQYLPKRYTIPHISATLETLTRGEKAASESPLTSEIFILFYFLHFIS